MSMIRYSRIKNTKEKSTKEDITQLYLTTFRKYRNWFSIFITMVVISLYLIYDNPQLIFTFQADKIKMNNSFIQKCEHEFFSTYVDTPSIKLSEILLEIIRYQVDSPQSLRYDKKETYLERMDNFFNCIDSIHGVSIFDIKKIKQQNQNLITGATEFYYNKHQQLRTSDRQHNIKTYNQCRQELLDSISRGQFLVYENLIADSIESKVFEYFNIDEQDLGNTYSEFATQCYQKSERLGPQKKSEIITIPYYNKSLEPKFAFYLIMVSLLILSVYIPILYLNYKTKELLFSKQVKSNKFIISSIMNFLVNLGFEKIAIDKISMPLICILSLLLPLYPLYKYMMIIFGGAIIFYLAFSFIVLSLFLLNLYILFTLRDISSQKRHF